MNLKRLFTTDEWKGIENYIDSQRRYEILRTILYFAISLCLFAAGWVQTKSRLNLLTVVAVLGCLPASKSLVSVIMFCRYKSCKSDIINEIKSNIGSLKGLYDCVFTSYKTNYYVDHLVVRNHTICGFCSKDLKESELNKHLQEHLKLDGHKDISIKIFDDLSKYKERLRQMDELPEHTENTNAILQSLKSIML